MSFLYEKLGVHTIFNIFSEENENAQEQNFEVNNRKQG